MFGAGSSGGVDVRLSRPCRHGVHQRDALAPSSLRCGAASKIRSPIRPKRVLFRAHVSAPGFLQASLCPWEIHCGHPRSRISTGCMRRAQRAKAGKSGSEGRGRAGWRIVREQVRGECRVVSGPNVRYLRWWPRPRRLCHGACALLIVGARQMHPDTMRSELVRQHPVSCGVPGAQMKRGVLYECTTGRARVTYRFECVWPGGG
ncbi:hypothetical protein C8Q78DRAFT_49112 [Trametes maxima]|nr:hypothetical protein C8Q78DRAFT_49112 [Trametes maxima]